MSIISNNPIMTFPMPGGGVTVNAEFGPEGYFKITSAGVVSASPTLTSLPAGSLDLVIPEIIDGINVTTIDNYAFYNCRTIASINIPNSVTSIGNSAFDGCTSLISISVDPNNPNYKSIAGVLFSKNGETLYQYPAGNVRTSYTIPNGVTTIGNSAFYYCKSLTSVTIGNSVTSIGNHAFYNCRTIASINIPNSVTSIGNNAFVNCESLISIDIPNSVTSIGNQAFQYCESLTSITIPNSVTSIGVNTFLNCTSLTSINIDKSVDSIEDAPWGANASAVKWLR